MRTDHENALGRERARGEDCPFKPATFQLEALSREIKAISTNLPADWDMESDLTFN